MEQRNKARLTNPDDCEPLTKSSAQFSFKHPNRVQQGGQVKTIAMNPRYRFRMGPDGCVYYLRDKRNG